jgi:hypothetical protein
MSRKKLQRDFEQAFMPDAELYPDGWYFTDFGDLGWVLKSLRADIESGELERDVCENRIQYAASIVRQIIEWQGDNPAPRRCRSPKHTPASRPTRRV